MGVLNVPKFNRGLDARRLRVNVAADGLIEATDCHVTRGGEIEKRAAFVSTYTLPAGTVSLAADADSIYVFGSGTDPGVPSGVAYQRLQNGGDTLERVVSWDLFNGDIYAVGEFDSGDITHYFNGTAVDRTGAPAYTFGVVAFGLPGDTFNVLINGVSVTGGAVAWAGSTALTEAAMIAAINSAVTVPDYTASALGGGFGFFIFAATVGTASNGLTVTVSNTGTGSSIFQSPTFGGVDAYVTDTRYVRTIGEKMYTLSEADLEFSSIGDPTDWDGDAGFGGVGYGFISLDQYASGAEDLTAIVNYRNLAAVFAPRTIQLWRLAADPANNQFIRVIRNTGTSCPRSVTEFGDADIFYLDESGVRSLRARDSSEAATTTGAGIRIDPRVTTKLRSLTEAERQGVIGLIEPQDGRFWLIMKDTIFVLSFFPDEGVNAWSVYAPGFNVDDAVVFDNRVYLRSGDTIYVYGGLATGRETDSTAAEAWLAYLDGETPAKPKQWESLAMAIRGEWAVAMATNLRDTDDENAVGVFTRTTYSEERTGLVGESTHISLRFRSQGDGEAILGAVTVNYA